MSPLLPAPALENLPPVIRARPRLHFGVGLWMIAVLNALGFVLFFFLGLTLYYHLETYVAPQPGDEVLEPFDRDAWISNESSANASDSNAATPRLRMCGAVVRDPTILGLNYAEAVDRLGPPSAVEPLPSTEGSKPTLHWMWSLDDPSSPRIDDLNREMSAWLVLRPDSNGRVERVEIHSWLYY
ncbi:MAG: hypothetical protein JNJ88_14340 [Planctomycetes bacterium]|nr:hypothetical protein [Planctomycetota bacterium]